MNEKLSRTEYLKKYRRENADKMKATTAKGKAEHPEACRQYSKTFRDSHPNYNDAYVEANREKINERVRKYYHEKLKNDPEGRAAQNKRTNEYRKNHLEYYRDKQRERRAKNKTE